MEGKDNIKELFSQKLGNYEAPVNPELWANISAQVAAGATTTVATGLSLFTKVAIGIGVSAAAITTVVLLMNSPKETVAENPKSLVENESSKTTAEDTEIEKVAELNDSEVLESIDNNDNKDFIPATIPNTGVTPLPDTGDDLGPDFTVEEITTKGVNTIVNNEHSEPIIVEGVTYGEMTNYGAAPSNTSTIEPESTKPKVEPIKRFTNTFTPNGDGINDFFELPSEGLTDFSVVVFNPNGDIVFQSNDPAFKWDGRDMRTGEIVEAGRSYMYMVSAYDSEGNPFPIYERLTINR